MFLYLLCVLFAYYILKPVSRAMFLNRFDIGDLPYLYILMAIGGGILAYAYSRIAVRTSLQIAVFWAMSLSVLCLVSMWYLLGLRLSWMIYVLNIFVSLFSVVLVSQGWLVASNLFTTREAKRLYSLLGLGMVAGAAFGGEFTNRTAALVGTRNLLLASGGMLVLAYLAFRLAIGQHGVPVCGTRATEESKDSFSFGDVAKDIQRSRHLQVLIGMMVITYVVDVLIEYQFQASAKLSFHGDQLTAFFGRFYGIYLNLTEFVLQFFVTGFVVSRFGVGGALQVLPASILLASTGTVAVPGIAATATVRLTEASTRYTVNRTGMELLYLPLPLELRNRIKAFVDIFVDRLSRGLGGMLLIVLTSVLSLSVREIAMLTMALTVPWIALSLRARKEYVATIRRRLAERRLDLESLRFTVRDPETLTLLEEASAGSNPRQACYALSLLQEVPEYPLEARLKTLAASPFPEVRAKVFDIARASGFAGFLGPAACELQWPESSALQSAITYLMAVSSDWESLAEDLLRSGVNSLVAGTIDALGSQPERARAVLTEERLLEMVEHKDVAVGAAALRATGRLRYLSGADAAIACLCRQGLREAAVEALGAYGPPICGLLGNMLEDGDTPAAIRRRLPRVLKSISDQRSVDVLLRAAAQEDLTARAAALRALNRLRETAPQLKFEDNYLTARILREARYYYELAAALAPVREARRDARTAAGLLVRTLEERLDQCLERLFRLLGLRYPPQEIYSAYLAVSRGRGDQDSALEFLENVLDRELKRILIPLLDAPDNVIENGRNLFGVNYPDSEAAIGELIESADPWLAACAMAAAAELGLRNLAQAIAEVGRRAGPEVCDVARSAEAALAWVGAP